MLFFIASFPLNTKTNLYLTKYPFWTREHKFQRWFWLKTRFFNCRFKDFWYTIINLSLKIYIIQYFAIRSHILWKKRREVPIIGLLKCDLSYYRNNPAWPFRLIEQKGMTFDHDFSSSFPPFLFPPTKEGRRKRERISIIVIKSHAFMLDHLDFTHRI